MEQHVISMSLIHCALSKIRGLLLMDGDTRSWLHNNETRFRSDLEQQPGVVKEETSVTE